LYNEKVKKLFRMFIFSAFALFLTSLWNKGFVLNDSVYYFVISVLSITIIYYLIAPILKLILLPLNLISFGIASFACILFLLHVLSSGFHLFNITTWTFEQMKLFGFTIPTLHISYIANLILSSVSISGIINILEQFL